MTDTQISGCQVIVWVCLYQLSPWTRPRVWEEHGRCDASRWLLEGKKGPLRQKTTDQGKAKEKEKSFVSDSKAGDVCLSRTLTASALLYQSVGRVSERGNQHRDGGRADGS